MLEPTENQKLLDADERFYALSERFEKEYQEKYIDEEDLCLNLNGEELKTVLLDALGITEHQIVKLRVTDGELSVILKKG